MLNSQQAILTAICRSCTITRASTRRADGFFTFFQGPLLKFLTLSALQRTSSLRGYSLLQVPLAVSALEDRYLDVWPASYRMSHCCYHALDISRVLQHHFELASI